MLLRNVSTVFNAGRPYVLLIFLLLNILVSSSVSRADDPVEIVMHLSVTSTKHNFTKNSLRAIFGMRLRTWPDGMPVKVFVLPDDAPLHKAFAKQKLNVFPYQLRSAWDRLIFSGTGQAPITVNSVDEMLTHVTNTPGAIGYLMRTKINDNIQILDVK
tara:strand:+ start:510 stop:983 length:474 start_codon:yes stop_codon:yes gene_type:complete